MRCPQSSPNPTSRGRIISFPSEANPSLPCAALGPAFSFFCHSLPVPPISPFHIDRRAFSHPGLPLSLDSSTTGSHRSNGAGNPLRWCRSPTQPPKPRTGPHTGFFSFLFIHSPPFPYGERLACFRNRTVPVFQICSQLAHTSPTGPVWCCAGVVSLPAPQNRTQALTGPSLVFTVFFSHLFSLAAWSVATPGGNSPLLGWVGSCKAVSRFSRSRPMSTRWSAGFR